jgi:hypothetical protein
MTISPAVSVVGILRANPSGLLFHILSNAISSLGMPAVYLFSSKVLLPADANESSAKEKTNNECWCDERPKTKAEGSTRFACTGLLGGLEHLKI